jgi:hypothetical protein
MDKKEKASNPGRPTAQQQTEGIQIPDQLDRVFEAFFDEPRTMKEVDKLTGVMRENVCWYCRTLRKQNALFPIGKRLCRVTKHRATEFTTDPAKIPNDPQLKLLML